MTPQSSDCAVCGESAEKARPWFPELAIRKCEGCGLVFADPVVHRIDPTSLYNEDYFHGEEYADYVRDRGVAELNFRGVRRSIRAWSRGGRLFEIGCAYGFFLHLCRDLWDAEGIDVSAPAVCFARETLGVSARQGEFLEEPITPASLDVVCMWDTLEHLTRPDLYIEKAARSLRPGGHLFLTTGDIGSWMARWRGARWRLVHPPTHLFYFDRTTVRQLMQRHGLDVVEIRSQGYYRSLDSMFFQASLRYPPGFVRRTLEGLSRFPLARVPIYTNLFDIMFVAARRRGGEVATAAGR